MDSINKPTGTHEKKRLAEAVKAACLAAALEGYEQAAFDGLCREGAWENAVEAIRRVDVEAIIRTLPTYSPSGE